VLSAAVVHDISTVNYGTFRTLKTSIANISGTEQAIDKRKMALSSTIFSTFDENNLVNFRPLTKK